MTERLVSAIVPVPAGTRPDSLAAALRSIEEQTAPHETIVALGSEDPAVRRAAGGVTVVDGKGTSPAELRNAGWSRAKGDYVCLVEPEERLAAKDVLARHVAQLDADATVAASYGQTSVATAGGTRVKPARGKGGKIERRLVHEKELIASAASVVWRRASLPARPFDAAYVSPSTLRLALSLAVAGEKPYLFLPQVVATAEHRPEGLESLEEKAKLFVALLYGQRNLDEKLENRVRFRLARHLVAIGKHHYRANDHVKAGKFFGEAVRAAPAYFKGRRYQFLNFLKRVFA